MMEYMKYREIDYYDVGCKVKNCRLSLLGRYHPDGNPDGSRLVLTDDSPDNMPFTQSMLLDYLRQTDRPHFGRNTLSKLENGDPAAFNGVTLNQWFALCEVFGVSLGWLLGEYDKADTIDGLWIHTKTGLTGKAIKVLTEWHRVSEQPGTSYNWARNALKAINDLLECGMWLYDRVLQNIAEYNVYRWRYENSKSDDDRKSMNLSYFMASDGLGDLMKNEIYK